MKIEHIALNVSKPKEISNWYAETLSMRISRSSEKAPYGHFIADSKGQTILEFYCNPLAPVPEYQSLHPLVFHIAFATDNIEATKKKLISAGATLVTDTVKSENGDILVMLRDPWGLALQLVKRHSPLI